MTSGEKMREQVLNALEKCKYRADLYHLTPSDKHYNSLIDGIMIGIRGLPSVDRKARK